MRLTIQFGNLFPKLKAIASNERKAIAVIVRDIVADYLQTESTVANPGNPNFTKRETKTNDESN